MMKLLLDTHAFIWWAAADPRLSPRALDALKDPENERYLSVVAAWEFQWLQLRSRIELRTPLETILETAPVLTLGLPFDLHRFSFGLPPVHGDPNDRMLIAQAIRDDMVLVTRDGPIHQYPVRTLW
jgi:PIN domain nuclease of toxin-antitoxin system